MIAIRFEHVSKSYPDYQHMLLGMKSTLFNLPKILRASTRKRFSALDDVSFEIKKGEAVGLVGPNGAGKSTMLGLIAGVIRPQAGNVEVRGRLSPLLQLGAGFNDELTGRENIVLNGILLGLTRAEVLMKMQEIISFSELEAFIDKPIRTYSTGMVARLGFSVAVHLDPEILLIDEILSVGDLRFQAKCHDKINEFRKRDITIILVSHIPAVLRQVCDSVIWLQDGRVVEQGDTNEVLNRYVESVFPVHTNLPGDTIEPN